MLWVIISRKQVSVTDVLYNNYYYFIIIIIIIFVFFVWFCFVYL